MSFFTLLGAIAKKKFEAKPTPPQRTKVPLRLSQGSAVEISIVPMLVAEQAGTLFGSGLADRHTITAVGEYTMMGLQFTRAYLSQNDGAYIHFATRNDEMLETRIYKPYSELIPTTADEWAFWLGDQDGYIGYSVMQSKDEDGPVQYQRSWSAGSSRIEPMTPIEIMTDLTGNITLINHQMMHYSRWLTDEIAEHLLVSAVQVNQGMSVAFWLGIDVLPGDLSVYPAHDAP